MIDFVVMRSGQRACCRDVEVMREASCWTDHNLGRAKLWVKLPHRVGDEKRSCCA